MIVCNYHCLIVSESNLKFGFALDELEYSELFGEKGFLCAYDTRANFYCPIDLLYFSGHNGYGNVNDIAEIVHQ